MQMPPSGQTPVEGIPGIGSGGSFSDIVEGHVDQLAHMQEFPPQIDLQIAAQMLLRRLGYTTRQTIEMIDQGASVETLLALADATAQASMARSYERQAAAMEERNTIEQERLKLTKEELALRKSALALKERQAQDQARQQEQERPSQRLDQWREFRRGAFDEQLGNWSATDLSYTDHTEHDLRLEQRQNLMALLTSVYVGAEGEPASADIITARWERLIDFLDTQLGIPDRSAGYEYTSTYSDVLEFVKQYVPSIGATFGAPEDRRWSDIRALMTFPRNTVKRAQN